MINICGWQLEAKQKEVGYLTLEYKKLQEEYAR